jgi:hypothetical protein
MSSLTPNFGFILPSPNDPTDQDLWGGMLNSNFTLLDTLLESVGEIPVGSLYFNATDATNPATLLGYGTWAAFGAGRVVIGAGSGTDSNGETVAFTAGATGGEYNHTLTEAEIPSHRHRMFNTDNMTSNGQILSANADRNVTFARTQSVNEDYGMGGTTTTPTLGYTGTAGSGDEHNNIQPYVVVYAWRRTA